MLKLIMKLVPPPRFIAGNDETALLLVVHTIFSAPHGTSDLISVLPFNTCKVIFLSFSPIRLYECTPVLVERLLAA